MKFRTAIFLSLVIHLAAGICLAFAVPKIFSEKILPPAEELEFVEVDFDAENFDEETPLETFEEETIPEFEFSELVLPELKIPEMNFTPPPIVVQPVEIYKPPVKVEKPPPAQIETEKKETPPPQPEKPVEKEKPAENTTPQKLNRPAVIVKEFYPTKDSAGNFTGTVIIAARIGKDGTVTGTKIIQGAGNSEIDNLAQDCLKKWNFRPAMDEKGQPMESDKIIPFDFKKAN